MRKAPVILMLVLVTGLPLAACFNDSETRVAEQEFRSAYVDPAQPAPHARETLMDRYHPGVLWMLSPAALLVVVLWVRRRQRARVDLPGHDGQRS